MTTRKNALNWFDLHVADFDRAKRFYETALDTKLEDCGKDEFRMAMFPHDMTDGVGGAITRMECSTPGAGGTVVYLNVEGDLDNVLGRIPSAGGSIEKPRTAIPPHGFIAVFKDTEGNIVGLHSME